MTKTGYEVAASSDLKRFRFISKNEISKREIEKVIEFANTEAVLDGKAVYNLAFGDVERDGSINDTNESNNGDIITIMKTIMGVVYQYTSHYSDRFIYFSGSTPQRTRFYQTILRRTYGSISLDFDIYGTTDDGYEMFQTAKEYDGFLVIRKLKEE